MQNALEFIDWYYNDSDSFFITLINNNTGNTRNYYHNKKTFQHSFKQVAYSNSDLNKSVYFTINGFKDVNECELNEYKQARKTKSNVQKIKSIVFDFDEPESSLVDLAHLIESLGITPTYIIETSPKKFQVCYRLEDSQIDFKEYELVNKTLAKLFKSDINVCSIEKVFRMPFFINRKNDFQCKIIEFNPNNTYSFDIFKDKVATYISQNETLNDYYIGLSLKNKPKPMKCNKTPKKRIQSPKKGVKSTLIDNILIDVDIQFIKKYKTLLKYNHDDASVVDILYIKQRAKSSTSYNEIFKEIISIRELVNKPLLRDLEAYYHNRSQFYDEAT